jgi:hypothetical protein
VSPTDFLDSFADFQRHSVKLPALLESIDGTPQPGRYEALEGKFCAFIVAVQQATSRGG